MNFKKIITPAVIAVSALAGTGTAGAALIINELMQSNIDCIMDDLNEFPDSWVELYNSGTEAENLSVYLLSDKPNPVRPHRLPDITLEPGKYIVVYCDKEGYGFHTPFRLESGKGAAVYLFKETELADKVEGLKKQPAPNIAYGRITDAAAEWGYQTVPTPGAANCGSVCAKALGEPVFSEKGRVADTPLSLSVGLPSDAPEGTVVRYTTDGSEPTAESALFPQTPLEITATTLVRAKLFCDGWLSPRSTTHSYIFPGREMGLPVVSLVTDNAYLYDDAIGIYVAGNRFDNGMDNFMHDWRRPVNIEFFEAGGQPGVINQLGETRLKGQTSRQSPLKSMVLYANKRFGVKRLEHEFFAEDAPGLSDWKSIELRNAGNDFDNTYYRDALAQRLMGRNADIDWQPCRPTAIYINGVYRGIINMRSRTNEDLVYTAYDGLEDIDMIESWVELKAGTWDSFNSFRDFYSEPGHTFGEYSARMDVEEYANYMAMELLLDNTDFPGNNLIMWRPTAEGGRWRWVAKDLDYVLGLWGHPADFPTFKWINHIDFEGNTGLQPTEESTRLFRNIMEVPEFRAMFIDRLAVYMGDFLHPRVLDTLIDEMEAGIAGEYPFHCEALGLTPIDRQASVEYIKNWFAARRTFFYSHMAEFYGLGKPCPVSIDAGRTDNVSLSVNGIRLRQRSFDGRYFAGGTLRIEAETDGELTGWQVKTVNGDETRTVDIETPVLEYTVPADCERVEIASITSASGIADIIADGDREFDFSAPFEIFDLAGRRIAAAGSPDALPAGVYILRQNGKSIKFAAGR